MATEANHDNVLSRASIYFASLVIVFCFFGLNFHQVHKSFNIDEEIPLSVILYLYQSGTFNTNWINTDVVSYFRYDQFNFSAYILFSYLILRLLSLFIQIFDNRQVLLSAIQNLSVFYACVTLVLVWLTARRMFGLKAAFYALSFAAATPLFVQDSLYARPESFTSLGFMLLLWCTVRKWAAEWRYVMVAGITAGLLTATKITLVTLALLPITHIVLGFKRPDDSDCLKKIHLILLFVLCTGFGFTLGAPYAVIEPVKYLNGVQYLMNQYSGFHPPHGPIENSIQGRFLHITGYFWEILGPGLVLCILGGIVLVLREGTKVEKMGLIIIPAVFMVYFLNKNVFFERNLSHVVPSLAILAAFAVSRANSAMISISRNKVGITVATFGAVAIILIQPATLSYALAVVQVGGAGQRDFVQFEAELRRRFNGFQIVNVDFSDVVNEVLPNPGTWNIIFKVTDFRDDWTHRYLSHPGMSEFSIVAHYYNSFTGLKGSTLHTYHAPDFIYLKHQKGPSSLITQSFSVIGQWQEGGYSPQTELLPFSAFGSWAGSDANTGTLKIGPFTGKQDEELIIFVTRGPDATGQRLALVSADDNQTVAEYPIGNLEPHQWAIWRFVVPKHLAEQSLNLIAADEGTGWGQWHGISAPYRTDAMTPFNPAHQLKWSAPSF